MPRILVTGSKGQLGSEMQIIAKSYPQFKFFFTDIEEMDISKKELIDAFVRENAVDTIVNCAAYTAVDKAEEEPEICYKVNCDAVRNIAEVAEKQGVQVIHLSTDYVYDGKNNQPYTEDDYTAPLSVYGKSKLAGELTLLSNCKQSIVIRSSWLYSSFGNNFVKTMLRLGKERDSLNVVFDQIGTPTYAADLAHAIMKIISTENPNYGVYQFSNEGVCSWYDFTKAIHRLAELECQVLPIETKDYPTLAQRPAYSLLNKAKIKSKFRLTIPHWEESLARCIKILKRDELTKGQES